MKRRTPTRAHTLSEIYSLIILLAGALFLPLAAGCGSVRSASGIPTNQQNPTAQAEACVANGGSKCFSQFSLDDLANEMEHVCAIDQTSLVCMDAANELADLIWVRNPSLFVDSMNWTHQCDTQHESQCSAMPRKTREQVGLFLACIKQADDSCTEANLPAPMRHKFDLSSRAEDQKMESVIAILEGCVGTPTSTCKSIAASYASKPDSNQILEQANQQLHQRCPTCQPLPPTAPNPLYLQVRNLSERVLAEPTYQPPPPPTRNFPTYTHCGRDALGGIRCTSF